MDRLEHAEERGISPVLMESQCRRGFRPKEIIVEIASRIYWVYDCRKEI